MAKTLEERLTEIRSITEASGARNLEEEILARENLKELCYEAVRPSAFGQGKKEQRERVLMYLRALENGFAIKDLPLLDELFTISRDAGNKTLTEHFEQLYSTVPFTAEARVNALQRLADDITALNRPDSQAVTERIFSAITRDIQREELPDEFDLREREDYEAAVRENNIRKWIMLRSWVRDRTIPDKSRMLELLERVIISGKVPEKREERLLLDRIVNGDEKGTYEGYYSWARQNSAPDLPELHAGQRRFERGRRYLPGKRGSFRPSTGRGGDIFLDANDPVIPKEIRNTSNVEELSDFLSIFREDLQKSDPLYVRYLERQIDVILRMEELITSESAKTAPPELVNIKKHPKGSELLIHQKAHQTSINGCWSVAYSNLLLSRGIDISQEDIRGYRQVRDVKEAGKLTPNEEKILFKDEMANPFEKRDLLLSLLPNTAIQEITLSESFGISNQEQRKITEGFLRTFIKEAIDIHHSPIALLKGKHYVTIVGYDGDTLIYQDSRPHRNDSKADQTYTDMTIQSLVSDSLTNPITMNSLVDLHKVPGKNEVFESKGIEGLTLKTGEDGNTGTFEMRDKDGSAAVERTNPESTGSMMDEKFSLPGISRKISFPKKTDFRKMRPADPEYIRAIGETEPEVPSAPDQNTSDELLRLLDQKEDMAYALSLQTKNDKEYQIVSPEYRTFLAALKEAASMEQKSGESEADFIKRGKGLLERVVEAGQNYKAGIKKEQYAREKLYLSRQVRIGALKEMLEDGGISADEKLERLSEFLAGFNDKEEMVRIHSDEYLMLKDKLSESEVPENKAALASPEAKQQYLESVRNFVNLYLEDGKKSEREKMLTLEAERVANISYALETADPAAAERFFNDMKDQAGVYDGTVEDEDAERFDCEIATERFLAETAASFAAQDGINGQESENRENYAVHLNQQKARRKLSAVRDKLASMLGTEEFYRIAQERLGQSNQSNTGVAIAGFTPPGEVEALIRSVVAGFSAEQVREFNLFLGSYRDFTELSMEEQVDHPERERINELREAFREDENVLIALNYADGVLSTVKAGNDLYATDNVMSRLFSNEERREQGNALRTLEGGRYEGIYETPAYLNTPKDGRTSGDWIMKPGREADAQALSQVKAEFSASYMDVVKRMLLKMEEMQLIRPGEVGGAEQGTKIYAFRNIIEANKRLKKAVQDGKGDELISAAGDYAKARTDMQELMDLAKEGFTKEYRFPNNVDVARNPDVPWEFARQVKTSSEVNGVYQIYAFLKNGLKPGESMEEKINEFFTDPVGAIEHVIDGFIAENGMEKCLQGKTPGEALLSMARQGERLAMAGNMMLGFQMNAERLLEGLFNGEPDAEKREKLMAAKERLEKQVIMRLKLEYRRAGFLAPFYGLEEKREVKDKIKKGILRNFAVVRPEDFDPSRMANGILTDRLGKPQEFDLDEYIRNTKFDYKKLADQNKKIFADAAAEHEREEDNQEYGEKGFPGLEYLLEAQKAKVKVLLFKAGDEKAPGYKDLENSVLNATAELQDLLNRYTLFDDLPAGKAKRKEAEETARKAAKEMKQTAKRYRILKSVLGQTKGASVSSPEEAGEAIRQQGAELKERMETLKGLKKKGEDSDYFKNMMDAAGELGYIREGASVMEYIEAYETLRQKAKEYVDARSGLFSAVFDNGKKRLREAEELVNLAENGLRALAGAADLKSLKEDTLQLKLTELLPRAEAVKADPARVKPFKAIPEKQTGKSKEKQSKERKKVLSPEQNTGGKKMQVKGMKKK